MKEDESLERTLERLAREAGALEENNRIAKAILDANFPPDIMKKLYEIISALPQ